ncbi:hypothetical protein CCHR01_16605 [Colletotrichum chrysophilum]|uniref:Uncharacterized protein n=1 Tax=Colletotrichum chrysophilum TaxID=1836956 RepID=A0AAD9A3V9_9PEZI|nr:hypothetical protein K456DRAFT_1443575 [Colletotrichum gloeosporioides 23]KAK1840763.1 hypothetical protein CCHR01_16605 [Colletotrichum chrysophilum]
MSSGHLTRNMVCEPLLLSRVLSGRSGARLRASAVACHLVQFATAGTFTANLVQKSMIIICFRPKHGSKLFPLTRPHKIHRL